MANVGDGSRVVGFGIDLVDLDRVARVISKHGERFVERLCGDEERREWERSDDGEASLAVRFAIKEAALKALGTGWAEGLSFSQVEVHLGGGGATARFLREAADRASRLGVSRVRVSASREGSLISAVVILDG